MASIFKRFTSFNLTYFRFQLHRIKILPSNHGMILKSGNQEKYNFPSVVVKCEFA